MSQDKTKFVGLTAEEADKQEIEWRIVPDFPAYKIGSNGIVLSRWGKGGQSASLIQEWHPIKPQKRVRGYVQVNLHDPDGRMRRVPVHCLVLEVFIGPRPENYHACHNDGNPRNNALSNLRWDTAKSNYEDRKKHGRDPVGEKNPASKLNPDKVRSIRDEFSKGSTRAALASKYGVSKRLICMVLVRKLWSHVE